MKIVSRVDAIKDGLDRYFTGKPCKAGHVAERRRDSGACLDCIGHARRKIPKMAGVAELTHWRPEGTFLIPTVAEPLLRQHAEILVQAWLIAWFGEQGIELSQSTTDQLNTRQARKFTELQLAMDAEDRRTRAMLDARFEAARKRDALKL